MRNTCGAIAAALPLGVALLAQRPLISLSQWGLGVRAQRETCCF